MYYLSPVMNIMLYMVNEGAESEANNDGEIVNSTEF